MKTNYLLHNKYKTIGWILLILGLTFGSYIWITNYESDLLTINVLSIFNDDLIFDNNKKAFKIIENSIIDELTCFAIIFGGAHRWIYKRKN